MDGYIIPGVLGARQTAPQTFSEAQAIALAQFLVGVFQELVTHFHPVSRRVSYYGR